VAIVAMPSVLLILFRAQLLALKRAKLQPVNIPRAGELRDKIKAEMDRYI
jgi:hypothetical protein